MILISYLAIVLATSMVLIIFKKHTATGMVSMIIIVKHTVVGMV